MVREQQECGYSRREDKLWAKGNKITGSALTKQDIGYGIWTGQGWL